MRNLNNPFFVGVSTPRKTKEHNQIMSPMNLNSTFSSATYFQTPRKEKSLYDLSQTQNHKESPYTYADAVLRTSVNGNTPRGSPVTVRSELHPPTVNVQIESNISSVGVQTELSTVSIGIQTERTSSLSYSYSVSKKDDVILKLKPKPKPKIIQHVSYIKFLENYEFSETTREKVRKPRTGMEELYGEMFHELTFLASRMYSKKVNTEGRVRLCIFPVPYENEPETDSECEPVQKGRREKGSIFLDLAKDAFGNRRFGTTLMNLSSDKRYTLRVDTALAYLVRISGFNPSNKHEIENNFELFENVESLLTSVKARLMNYTKLTTLKKEDEEDFEDSEKPLEQRASMVRELEGTLITNLPTDKYTKVRELINSTSETKPQSVYLAKKKVNKMVKEVEFLHVEDSADEGDDTEDNVEAEMKCSGAYVEFSTCVDVLLDKIRIVLKEIPGATMEEALLDACIITCLDGAVHDSLPKKDRNIITYSITIVSRYLIEKCKIYPSSGKWILPHVQIQAKENKASL